MNYITSQFPENDSSAQFKLWVPFMRNQEGDPYVNDPKDAGGPTRRGITIGTWSTYAPMLFNIPGTVETLKNSTIEQADKVSWAYWNDSKIPKFKSNGLKLALAEFAWGSGPNATWVLQQVLNRHFNAGLREDAALGPITIAAANRATDEDEIKLLTELKNGQIKFINASGYIANDYKPVLVARVKQMHEVYIPKLFTLKKKTEHWVKKEILLPPSV